MTALIWIVLAVGVWGIVHSWLASLGVKEGVERALGAPAARFYRAAYNLFSVVSLLPILVLVRILPDRVLYVVPSPWRYLMLAGQLLSLLGLLLAFRETDAVAFIGVRQLLGMQESSELVTGGLYLYVRHPMYLFGLLVLWLTPAMTMNMLVLWAALSLYLIIGAYFEERKLTRIFGTQYAAFKARTPMIVPFLRLPANARRDSAVNAAARPGHVK